MQLSIFDEPQSAFLWNDCGVCTNPQTAASSSGHGWSYSILLAQKPNGLWVSGYDYTIKNGGGGGYPNLCDPGHETADIAIAQEIISVRAKIN